MKHRTLWSLILLLAAQAPTESSAASWKPELMDKKQEIAEALAAGPETVRGNAGVYVLTTAGFELVRESGNGFHCLVERSQPGAFEPQCFDAEGSTTLLQQVLLRGKLRMEGGSPEEIAATLGEAWAAGRLRAPERPGINYMLSERNRVPVGPDRVIPYRPHVMFYAPDLTNEDVGGDLQGKSPVCVIKEGQPSAYVIVPVPRKEEPKASAGH